MLKTKCKSDSVADFKGNTRQWYGIKLYIAVPAHVSNILQFPCFWTFCFRIDEGPCLRITLQRYRTIISPSICFMCYRMFPTKRALLGYSFPTASMDSHITLALNTQSLTIEGNVGVYENPGLMPLRWEGLRLYSYIHVFNFWRHSASVRSQK